MTEQAIPLHPDDFDAALVRRLIRSKHPHVRVAAIRLVDLESKQALEALR